MTERLMADGTKGIIQPDTKLHLIKVDGWRWGDPALMPPTSGAWADGDRIRLVTPTSGGIEGYVRVSGVWKTFGAIG